MEELFNQFDWRITLEEAALPDGRIKKVPVVHRPSSVHILAFPTPGELLLIREYRPYYGEYLWMLPSGRIDKEKDMTIAAQRELQEETGFRAKKLEYWCAVNHSETLAMTNFMFIASDLEKAPLPQDEDEFIEVHSLPIEEALQKILSSPKVHTASAFGVLRYLHDTKK